MMAFKPNRPVRVGTEMMMTDAKGELPTKRASKALDVAPPKQAQDEDEKPARKPRAKKDAE